MALTDMYCSVAGAGAHDGTSAANAWTLLEAATNHGTGQVINIEGSHTITSDFTPATTGTLTAPVFWRGCSSLTSIGDGNQGRNADGTLDTSNMPSIVLSGFGVQMRMLSLTFHVIESLNVSSTDNGQYLIGEAGANCAVVNCNLSNTSTSGEGITASAVANHVIDCDVVCTGSSAAFGIKMSGSYNTVAACRISVPNAATGVGAVEMGGHGAAVLGNLIYEAPVGLFLNGANACRCHALGNTIVDCDEECILHGNANGNELGCFAGNLLTDAAYGYNSDYATAHQRLFWRNRFDRITTSDVANVGDWPNMQAETTVVTQANEYTDASTDDYTLASTSPAVDAGPWPSVNLGYWQHGA